MRFHHRRTGIVLRGDELNMFVLPLILGLDRLPVLRVHSADVCSLLNIGFGPAGRFVR